VAQFHSADGPLTFTARDHTDFVDAFYRIGQDRANKIVVLRGTGGDFIPGIDKAKVDEEFFATGKPDFGSDEEFFPDGHVKSNFLSSLGYGDSSTLFPRLPRLSFKEVCSLL
jgi:3-hydroxypropanoate dehydrogenase